MKILVVGGAGYIGSHMVKQLALAGHDVITLDNLSYGYRDAVKYGEFVEGDLGDATVLNSIFAAGDVDAVMHFAGFIQVGESVEKPSMYYLNNVVNTHTLLDAMLQHNVKNFIFSSTAAIFGEPEYTPIDEKHRKQPINPYGHSKLMIEQVLDDYDKAYGLRSTCLRYFNAAGADPEGELGERHVPETHLIPLILQAASGRREDIKVFGDDYPTDDGTCVRDYIHINDLCEAHSLALHRMIESDKSARYNLGNGKGFSVKQVIDAQATAQALEHIKGVVELDIVRPPVVDSADVGCAGNNFLHAVDIVHLVAALPALVLPAGSQLCLPLRDATQAFRGFIPESACQIQFRGSWIQFRQILVDIGTIAGQRQLSPGLLWQVIGEGEVRAAHAPLANVNITGLHQHQIAHLVTLDIVFKLAKARILANDELGTGRYHVVLFNLKQVQ